MDTLRMVGNPTTPVHPWRDVQRITPNACLKTNGLIVSVKERASWHERHGGNTWKQSLFEVCRRSNTDKNIHKQRQNSPRHPTQDRYRWRIKKSQLSFLDYILSVLMSFRASRWCCFQPQTDCVDTVMEQLVVLATYSPPVLDLRNTHDQEREPATWEVQIIFQCGPNSLLWWSLINYIGKSLQ